MKNIILIVAILSLSVGILVAQPVFGLRAGLNIGTFTGEDNMDDYSSKIGFHAGVMMQYPLSTKIIIQPEFLYTMKGATADLVLFGDKNELTASDNYLEIPLLLKFNVETPSIKIQPYIGPSVGYLLVGKVKNVKTVGGVTSTDTVDFTDDMNLIEAGLNIGADVVVMQNFMLGLRFNMGLTETVKENSKFKNNVIMLNLGYLFGN